MKDKKILKEIQNMIIFGKSRVAILLGSNLIAWFFVDILGIRYWKFAIFFIPALFLANYFVNKHVFNKILK